MSKNTILLLCSLFASGLNLVAVDFFRLLSKEELALVGQFGFSREMAKMTAIKYVGAIGCAEELEAMGKVARSPHMITIAGDKAVSAVDALFERIDGRLFVESDELAIAITGIDSLEEIVKAEGERELSLGCSAYLAAGGECRFEMDVFDKASVDAAIIKVVDSGTVRDLLAILNEIEDDMDWFEQANSALISAAQRNRLDIVDELLDFENVNVNALNDKNETALSVAIGAGHIDVVKRLVQEDNICISTPDIRGMTPLLRASACGSPYLVDLLIRKGADCSAQDNAGDSALMIAIRCGYMGIVDFLLMAGVDVDIENNNGETARTLALARRDFELEDRLMARSKYNINIVDSDGRTALMRAVLDGNRQKVSALLTLPEINLHNCDYNGRDALMIASNAGHVEIVDILMRALGLEILLPEQEDKMDVCE